MGEPTGLEGQLERARALTEVSRSGAHHYDENCFRRLRNRFGVSAAQRCELAAELLVESGGALACLRPRAAKRAARDAADAAAWAAHNQVQEERKARAEASARKKHEEAAATAALYSNNGKS